MTAPDPTSWVSWLYRDPSERRITELTEQWLEQAGDREQRTRVLEEARAAQVLAAELRDHRKRAVELTSLNDLALRLASMHDLPSLLHSTVSNARQLLGVDLAYLAVREPDGLRIQVTDGGLSRRLEGVLIPSGSGLAGRVVDLEEPVQSSDYLNDDRLAHHESVDAVAISEGVRSILGTPLKARDNLFGVLMVSSRTVRGFASEEVLLLKSLAAIAAVAIDNAQMIERYRGTARELADLNEQLRQRMLSTDQAASLHETLLGVALGGGGVAELIRRLSKVFPGDLLYADEADRVVFAAEGGRLADARALAPVQGVAPSELFASAEHRRTCVEDGIVTVPVATRQVYFGALQTRSTRPIAGSDVRSLERAAMTLALVASGESAVAEAERRSVGEFLEQLLLGRGDPDGSLARRAGRWGLDLLVPHRVLVTMPLREDVGRLRQVGQDLVRGRQGLAEVLSGALVVVVRADALEWGSWAERLGSLGTTGVSDEAIGGSGMQAAYQEARACLAALLALDRAGDLASPDDLGPYRFLLSQAGRADAVRFVGSIIGPLVAHDADKGSDLVRTADAFLTNGRQHAGTASQLSIHANTLYQRLERITALLGAGWREGDRALDVQLALRLHRLGGSVSGA